MPSPVMADTSPALSAAQALAYAHELVAEWESGWEPTPVGGVGGVDAARFAEGWTEFARRMAGNHPFFHPRYAGQMLKPPHPAAVAGYVAALLVNPNNHALDGGPVTSEMEKEAIGELAGMLGLPPGCLGHLTSGGTVANLEALWVARELRPGARLLHSCEAHSTHARMCQMLGVPATSLPVDPAGRLDLAAAEEECRRGDVGTLVVTAGTTALGAVDDVAGALELRERYGVRVHVDAAYGGFFALLAGTGLLGEPAERALQAVGGADSVVIDPHKHGLQPYGCGAVLFADPGVARLYRHDSPYTYFTSDDLHLGEISLECSRPGAAAAALWLTLRLVPLRSGEGLGPVLAAGRRAALAWAAQLDEAEGLRLYQPPELDILTYFPWRPGADPTDIGAAARRILDAGMRGPDQVWLSLLQVTPAALAARHPDLPVASAPLSVVRSVLMKPEHEAWVDRLHRRVVQLAGEAWEPPAAHGGRSSDGLDDATAWDSAHAPDRRLGGHGLAP